jgi:hypothetical protein
MEWKHSVSCARKKFKTRPAMGMVMLTIFGDMVGHIHYLEGQKTINRQYYSDLIKNKTKPVLHHRCPILQREGVILFHDNVFLIVSN